MNTQTLAAGRGYIQDTLITFYHLKNITVGHTKLHLVAGEDLGHEVCTNLVELQIFMTGLF